MQNSSDSGLATLDRVCPLCRRDNRDRRPLTFSFREWRIKSCGDCGFVYLENVLEYDELVRNHAWVHTTVAERRRRQERERLFSLVSQSFKAFRRKFLWRPKAPEVVARFVKQGNLLDIGCGQGELLARLEHKLVPHGIEIGAEAASPADRRARCHGGRVWQSDALGGLRNLDANYFDGILMHSYLEHENSPAEVLRESFRVLKPEGRVVIKVPNFGCWNRRIRGQRWCGFRYPDHVNYYTPATLRQMVESVGLRAFQFGLGYRLPTSDNMWMIAEKPRSAVNANDTSAHAA